jgi:hypothetical protein
MKRWLIPGLIALLMLAEVLLAVGAAAQAAAASVRW